MEMETQPILYRKRLIPSECIELKDDQILYRDDRIIVTKWNTIRPKKDLDHGYSCYFMKKGFKVSRFYGHENQHVCWYCDIIDTAYDAELNAYTFTDLLVDVILTPDGSIKVVDVDELADAMENKLISQSMLLRALRRLDYLLSIIYQDRFGDLQREILTRE
ncbi:DUF402 domain-containing protein [Diplocloster agilis]|uniref:DUF402 domain-containing protein n=1 Tax=Diplocloster agilis TaxID=2850323 RepID=UPI000822414F|nr:DUF402 domain-containing protein [Suonthocola fibrivorans]SCJ91305.1 Protein of uncharacterised function (DUF402) [uncultured Clostridium sp.]